jgi:hypothetical protein
MDMPTSDFVRACSLAELQAKGRLVVHDPGGYDGGRVFALDKRCPNMGFCASGGSVFQPSAKFLQKARMTRRLVSARWLPNGSSVWHTPIRNYFRWDGGCLRFD